MSQATSITVHVPLNIQRRGGRKVVIAPDGSVLPLARPSLVPPTADPVLGRRLEQGKKPGKNLLRVETSQNPQHAEVERDGI